ncbi:MAG: S1C family serine protease [Anaerolineales bacterium]
MSEKRFSVGVVILLVLLGVGIAVGSMVSGVFLGYQWGRSAGRSGAFAQPHRAFPRSFEHLLPEQLVPQFIPPQFEIEGRPFLGVSFQPVNGELARQHDLTVNQGAWITQVVPGSPAEKAELKVGDVILAVDGQEVKDNHPLPDLINAHKPGDRIELLVLRGQREHKVEVELAGRPGGFMPEGLMRGEGFPHFYFQFHCFPEPCPQFEDRP